jgi:ABC-type transport system involved in cytochrome bd biosynthesis fused ATPase/permease subunit
MAMLEELEIVSGNVDIQGSVFYVSQEPWIFTASIKQSILFGKPFDEKKFYKVVSVCCLSHVKQIVFLIQLIINKSFF